MRRRLSVADISLMLVLLFTLVIFEPPRGVQGQPGQIGPAVRDLAYAGTAYLKLLFAEQRAAHALVEAAGRGVPKNPPQHRGYASIQQVVYSSPEECPAEPFVLVLLQEVDRVQLSLVFEIQALVAAHRGEAHDAAVVVQSYEDVRGVLRVAQQTLPEVLPR